MSSTESRADTADWRQSGSTQQPAPSLSGPWSHNEIPPASLSSRQMTTPIKLTRGETPLPRTFVYCTLDKTPGSPQAERAERVKNDPRWQYFEINTGHNLHYTAPKETVALLLQLASAPVAAR